MRILIEFMLFAIVTTTLIVVMTAAYRYMSEKPDRIRDSFKRKKIED